MTVFKNSELKAILADGNFKYNIGLSTRVGKFSDSWIGASYTNDVNEIANTLYDIEKNPLNFTIRDL
jgi:hypothetical protein